MKKIVTLFCSTITSILMMAQKKLPGLGEVDIAALHLKSCSFEPDAPAMKLFDVQETSFEISAYNARLKTERRVRIKVFNEKGYKHASVKIPYFSKKGIAKIKELNGAIYNVGDDGKIIVNKLEKKDFFKEKAADNVGVVNFTFPGLKPGSIIEYSYTTIENNLIYLNPWFIQDEIPVVYSSCIITTPVQSKIFERVFGSDTIEQKLELLKYDNFRKITYSKGNIPSFKPEPFMSSVKDHLIKVSFLLFPGGAAFYNRNRTSPNIVWGAAGSQMLHSKFYEDQVKKTIPGTEKIIDSAKAILKTDERIGYIYGEVKKRVPVKTEQTTSADNLTEAWNDKTGTSAEINLILLNLLEKSNIKSLPILASTRDNGKIDKGFPSISQANAIDVLAFDSAKFYVLDASLKFQSYQNPPQNILNREAFILSPDSMQWVTISDTRPLLKQSMLVLADLTENGLIEGTASIQYFDYAKANKLDTTTNENEEAEDRFYDKKPQGLKILSTSRSEAIDDGEPLFESVEFTYEPNEANGFYFINPQILTEKNKNPFLAEKRNTDIDFGCNQLFILTMQIRFPDSYVIEHLPKNVIVRAPDSSFFYKINYVASTKEVSISQLFEVKRAIYNKEEYKGIQDFFKHMYALMAEEIILKKKK